MRRSKYRIRASRITDNVVPPNFKEWTAIYRERKALARTGIINPTAVAIEDAIESELGIIEQNMFPQTANINEPYLLYTHSDNYTVDNINEVYLSGIPISELHKIVYTEDDMFADDFEELQLYKTINIDINEVGVSGEVGWLGFGDVQDDVLNVCILRSGDCISGNLGHEVIADLQVDVSVKHPQYDDYEPSYIIENYIPTEERSIPYMLNGGNYLQTELFIKDVILITIDGIGEIKDTEYELISLENYTDQYSYTCDFNNNYIVDDDDRREMIANIGVTIDLVEPEVWNSTYRKYDFNKDGIIDYKDVGYFDIFYKSVRERVGTIIRLPETHGRVGIQANYYTDFYQKYTYIEDIGSITPILLRNPIDEVAPIFPSDTIDVAFDLKNGYYITSSEANRCFYIVLSENDIIKEKVKVPIGDFYDYVPRGIKWKDDFIFVLLHKDSTNNKVVVFDMQAEFIEKFIDVYDIEDELINPTCLTVTSEDQIIICDGNNVYIFKPVRRKILLRGNKVYAFEDFGSGLQFMSDNSLIPESGLVMEPYSLWNTFDEYAMVPYGLERIPGEDNVELLMRMNDVIDNLPGTTKQGLINAIQRDLGYPTYTAQYTKIYLPRTPDPTKVLDFQLFIDDLEYFYEDVIISGLYYTFYNDGEEIITIDDKELTILGPGLYNHNFVFTYYNDDEPPLDRYTVSTNLDPFIEKDIYQYPYIELFALYEEDYLYNEDNGFFLSGMPTSKLINIVNHLDHIDISLWKNAIVEESFFDSLNYDDEIAYIYTYMDVYPSGHIMGNGIGDYRDLETVDITLDSPDEESIILTVDGEVIVEQSSSEIWKPHILPGYFYIDDVEYYCFSNKTTEFHENIDSNAGDVIELIDYPAKDSPIILNLVNSLPTSEDIIYFKDDIEITNNPLEFNCNERFARTYESESSDYTIISVDNYIYDSFDNQIVFISGVTISGDIIVLYDNTSEPFKAELNISPITCPIDEGFISLKDSNVDEPVSGLANDIIYEIYDNNLNDRDHINLIVQVVDDTYIPLSGIPIKASLYMDLRDEYGNEVYVSTENYNNLYTKYNLNITSGNIAYDDGNSYPIDTTLQRLIVSSSCFLDNNYNSVVSGITMTDGTFMIDIMKNSSTYIPHPKILLEAQEVSKVIELNNLGSSNNLFADYAYKGSYTYDVDYFDAGDNIYVINDKLQSLDSIILYTSESYHESILYNDTSLLVEVDIIDIIINDMNIELVISDYSKDIVVIIPVMKTNEAYMDWEVRYVAE